MKKKTDWILPFDERLIPDVFSFQYPKSPWVKLFLFIEISFAVIVVIGTLILVLLPTTTSRSSPFESSQTTTDYGK